MGRGSAVRDQVCTFIASAVVTHGWAKLLPEGGCVRIPIPSSFLRRLKAGRTPDPLTPPPA